MAPAPGCTAPMQLVPQPRGCRAQRRLEQHGALVLPGVAAIPPLEQPGRVRERTYPRSGSRRRAGSRARRSRRARFPGSVCHWRIVAGVTAESARSRVLMRRARHGATQSAPRYRSWSRGSCGSWLADARKPCAGVALWGYSATAQSPVQSVARVRSIAEPVAAAVARRGCGKRPGGADGDGAGRGPPRACSAAAIGSPPSRRAIPAPYALARPGGRRRSRAALSSAVHRANTTCRRSGAAARDG